MTYSDLQQHFFVIAGPCVIESRDHSRFMAQELKRITEAAGVPFIFKASYDKANRTSADSYRGLGLREGLKILAEIRKDFGIPILSDIHESWQAINGTVAEALDVIQIPALLSRQTDLLIRAGFSRKIVNVKKGQFAAPADMKHVIDKIRSTGNDQILLTERGTTFGYNNLVVDFRSIPIMQNLGVPVVFDATHSVQLPGGQGAKSGGQAEFIPVLAKAAVAAGVNGLFLEVHDNPEKALSDGPNALRLDLLPDLLETLARIRSAVQTSFSFRS